MKIKIYLHTTHWWYVLVLRIRKNALCWIVVVCFSMTRKRIIIRKEIPPIKAGILFFKATVRGDGKSPCPR